LRQHNEAVLAYSRTEPSERYRELLSMYTTVHDEGLPNQNIPAAQAFSGGSLKRQMPLIRGLIQATGAKSVLDYGSGKGGAYRTRDFLLKGQPVTSVQDYWGVERIVCYDPAYTPYSTLPEGEFDGVICVDVLEHLPEQDLPWVLEEQFRYARKFVFGNIASYPADKILPNGENAHCTIQPLEWWRDTIIDARARAGSSAEYLFTVETKEPRNLLGFKMKPATVFRNIASRPDWPPQN
jgi:hypothetical protein